MSKTEAVEGVIIDPKSMLSWLDEINNSKSALVVLGSIPKIVVCTSPL